MKQTKIDYGQSAAAPQTGTVQQPFIPEPNPKLTAFVEKHRRPYNRSSDEYNASPFDKDLSVHKHNKLYTLHLYWSKKDPVAISEYIRHYTRQGDLVLDPFCGSGTTGCAALSMGRKAVLIDVSASAAYLAYHYCISPDPADIDEIHKHLLADGRGSEVDRLYATRCHRCKGPALIEFVVWSDSYQCPGCTRIVPLFDCVERQVQGTDGTKTKRVCPNCLSKAHGEASPDFVISTRSKKFAPEPVACKFLCLGTCKPRGVLRLHNDNDPTARRYFREHDVAGIEAARVQPIHDWYPRRRMMDSPKDQEVWGAKWRKGAASFQSVEELFTHRNLACVAKLCSASDLNNNPISSKLFVTWILHKCSNLMGYGADGVGRVGVGNYSVPPIRMEARPTKYLGQAKRQILAHFTEKSLSEFGQDFCLSVESNIDALKKIPSNSVDYVFTDPPYLNPEVQYGEMNFLWDAWLGFPSSIRNETTFNPIQGHSWEEAEDKLRRAISGVFDVLKPGRWLSICYHDTSEANWSMLQDALLDAGFEIRTVNSLEPRSKSRKAITAEKIVKSDLVVNCRKPKLNKPGAEVDGDVAMISARVRDIVLETLSHIGGQTRDKLWDIVLKRLLSRGQMAAHRFDDILSEVAFKSESGRWFLKEAFEGLSQSDTRNEEDAGTALEGFARLRAAGVPVQFAAVIALERTALARPEADEQEIERYIKERLIDDLAAARKFRLAGRLKGIEFYDCLFFYLTRFLKGRPPGKTPRRNLAQFLEEYVVRFKDGDKWLYRPPDRAEAESLRKSRQTGLGRRIRQYVAYLRGEGEYPKEKMPDAKTLVAWLKHCSAFGLADEGVAIYERGGLMAQLYTLSEDERYDADEYYTNCKRKASKTRDEDDEENVDAEGDDESGTEEE